MIPDFEEGCRSCQEYQMSTIEDIKPIVFGETQFGEEVYRWVVVESRLKAVTGGRHLIFTTWSHHVGAEEVEARAALNAEATRVAAGLLSNDFRLTNNSGPKSSTRSHYHVHLISPEAGDRLPRDVANVQDVLEEFRSQFGASSEMIEFLDQSLLQQK